jgi:hypothetical protein
MTKRGVTSGMIALALLAAGCQSISGPSAGVSLLPVKAMKANVFFGAPTITGVTAADGLGRLNFKLHVKGAKPVDPIAARYGILALSNGAGGAAVDANANGSVMDEAVFTEAVVTLYSSTANGTFDPTKHSRTLAKAAFSVAPDGAGYYTAAGGFGALRPATDYVAGIYLRNNAGAIATKRLGASAANGTVTIQAGASNNVDFTCTVNGKEATYNLSSSNYGNNVSDGGVVKGDTVTFNTGIANSQPGVDHVDVQISGAAYGGASAIVKRITTPASFSSFSWNTGADSAGAGETYLTASLSAPATGTAGTAGQVDIIAYDVNGVEVGRAAFAVTVFGTPTTTIRVK